MIEEYVASKAMFNPNVIYLIRRYKIIVVSFRWMRETCHAFEQELGDISTTENLDNNGKVAKNFSSSLEVEPSSERIVTI